MQTAHSASRFQSTPKLARVVVPALLLLASITAPLGVQAAAGGIQICEPGVACEIGEFLYDDTYSPITTASCTITSRYPNETLYVSGASLTSNTDGWYSYIFTTPMTEGLYRTEVCCTAGTDYLCIDKSFEAKGDPSLPSTNDIASAVWGYSDRTLTSLGTLVRDIWLHSNRTMTSLSTTSTTSTAGDLGDLEEINKTTKENRLLLEELVNKPIIETYLEEEATPDLGVKLDQTRSTANQLFANNEYLRSKTDLVISRWNSYSEDELMSILVDLDNVLGAENDSATQSSFFASANWLNQSWDWAEAEDIYEAATSLKRLIASTKITVSTYGKSSLAYQNMRSLGKYFDQVELAIGESTDKSGNSTLFGHYREVSDLATLFDNHIADIDQLLTSWQGTDPLEIRTSLNSISQKAVPINQIPQLRTNLGIASAGLSEKELKNTAFSVRGVLDTNRIMLARPSGSPLANTWLELGSIVFKTVVTNPSTLITQEVPLKYYLPPEIREEHITKTDEGLRVDYDSEKDQYFVSGDFKLEPGEAITLKVSVDDIWVITDLEVDSLKNQAAELMRPLENNGFFAQGVTLKSDIDVSLDKILTLQSAAVTPEAKIRAFREAQIELNSVYDKIDSLKDLVTAAGQNGTLFGFIGGVQALAVWGLIIIMAAGFVFLALYMKVLNGGEKPNAKSGKPKSKKSGPKSLREVQATKQSRFDLPKFVRTALPFIIFGALVSGSTAAIVLKLAKPAPAAEAVLGHEDTDDVPLPKPQAEGGGENDVREGMEGEARLQAPGALATGGQEIIMISVPSGSSLNLRSKPGGAVIDKLSDSLEAIQISEEGDWTNVLLKFSKYSDKPLEAWVHSDFVIAPDLSSQQDNTVIASDSDLSSRAERGDLSVTIAETPTGYLNVRTTPGGKIIIQANPGETYKVIDQTDSWYMISLENSTGLPREASAKWGWVSKSYVTLN